MAFLLPLRKKIKCHSENLITKSHLSDIKCQFQLLEETLWVANLAAFVQCHCDPFVRCPSACLQYLKDKMRPGNFKQKVTPNCNGKGISLFILHFKFISEPSSLFLPSRNPPPAEWAVKVVNSTFVLRGLNIRHFIETQSVLAFGDLHCQCSDG